MKKVRKKSIENFNFYSRESLYIAWECFRIGRGRLVGSDAAGDTSGTGVVPNVRQIRS